MMYRHHLNAIMHVPFAYAMGELNLFLMTSRMIRAIVVRNKWFWKKFKAKILFRLFLPFPNPGHIRAEVWMSISGGFQLLNKSPDLYRNLLNAPHDNEIGLFYPAAGSEI